MVRIFAFAVAFALAVATPCSASAADETDPIVRHVCAEHWSGQVDGRRRIDYQISDIWAPFDAPLIELGGAVAFTDRPGRFLNINCSDNGIRQTETQEFYPIGMVLRPIRALTLGDREVDVFIDPTGRVTVESPRTYLLVLTEFGHLKIIRERDVQYMISGATYFFSEGTDFILLCDRADDCPGNQRLVFNPGAPARPVCDVTQCRQSTAIAPMGGYAVGGTALVVDGDPHTDWSRVELARQALRDHGIAGVDRGVIDDYCRPFRVKAFQSGGRARLDSDDAEYLTLCIERGTARRPPLRDIDKNRALALFDDLAEGIFFRQFGSQQASLVSVLNSASGPEQAGRKECAQSISTATRTNLEVTGGWKLVTGLFEFGSSVEASASSTLETLISDEEYVRFSNFLAPDFYSDRVHPLEDRGSVYNLVFIVACDGQTVEKAKAVVLDYPAFLDGRMEIRAQDLTNSYFRLNGTVDDSPPGYDANQSADFLRAGQFFDVHDIQTYYLWKSTIANHLTTKTVVGTLLDEFEDPARANMVLDFFTHLLLAAIFRYDITTEIRTPTSEF